MPLIRDSPINRPECRSCGYHHGNRQCPARGQTCHKCGEKNHFQSKCRSTNPKVNNVEEVPEEVFRISQVATGTCALITMEVGMQNIQSKVTFQLDTDAECNLLSLKDYRRVMADEDLTQLKRYSHKFIKTYTNERYKILGSTELPTWRHGKRNVLQFNITEDDLAPLLSYSTCIGLGLVTINDCDSPSNSSGGLKDTPGVHVTTRMADTRMSLKAWVISQASTTLSPMTVFHRWYTRPVVYQSLYETKSRRNLMRW